MTRTEFNNIQATRKMMIKEAVHLAMDGGKRFDSLMKRIKELESKLRNAA